MAVAYALKVADFVTDGTHHATDFTVLAFDKHKFCKSVFEIDVCCKCDFFLGVRIFRVADVYAIDQALGGGFAERTRCPHVVAARHFEARVREAVKQFAVVGKQQETAALQVESSDVLEIMVSRRQVIVNRAAALRVVLGANTTGRLVEHDDFCFLVCRELQQLSVNRHLILGFVHLMAEVRDRFSVHLYATVGDEFVCGAAASETTERNVLVYTHNLFALSSWSLVEAIGSIKHLLYLSMVISHWSMVNSYRKQQTTNN